MKRIRLTQPNGSPLVVVVDNVSEFFANDGSHVRAAKTIVSMVNGQPMATSTASRKRWQRSTSC